MDKTNTEETLLNSLVEKFESWEWAEDLFPIDSKMSKVKIEGFKQQCSQCDEYLWIKGKIIENLACLEFHCIGFCEQCNIITKLQKLRFYRDGRVLRYNQDTNYWDSLKDDFKNLILNLFRKKKNERHIYS